MDNSVLHPPGFQTRSDSVIGEVMQRSPPVARPDRTIGGFVINPASIDSSTQRLAGENSARSESTEPAVISAVRLESPPVSPELALRRQRRRVSMARYRKKQSDRAVALERDVEVLREEIKKLTVQYTSVAAQVTTQTTPWSVAAEYFRLFRHGSPPTSATRANEAIAQVQRDFLRASIAPDMLSGTGCGVEAHLEVWRLCALYHQDFDLRLARLESGDGGSLVATTCTAAITTDTLRFAFPRLVQRDQAGSWSPLVAQLLGQTLVIPGSTRFKWDEAKNCVVSVDYTADMLTPLLRLLGSLEDVSSVFDNALVTPECKFVAVDATQTPTKA